MSIKQERPTIIEVLHDIVNRLNDRRKWSRYYSNRMSIERIQKDWRTRIAKQGITK